jgi:hypothetical protein
MTPLGSGDSATPDSNPPEADRRTDVSMALR